MDELEFETGGASLATLQALTDAAWADLAGEAGRAELAALGFDPALADAPSPYEFRPKQAGAVGIAESITIGVILSHHVGSAAKTVFLDIWRKILLPKLRRRFGEDVVGRERRAAAQAASSTTGTAKGAKSGETKAAKKKSGDKKKKKDD
jgi:hypothetical protein